MRKGAIPPNEYPPPKSKLEFHRRDRGLRQDELARAVGIAVATYQRLERGEMRLPPLPYLVNCARALGVELEQIIENEWLEWHSLSRAAREQPEPEWWEELDESAHVDWDPVSRVPQKSRRRS